MAVARRASRALVAAALGLCLLLAAWIGAAAFVPAPGPARAAGAAAPRAPLAAVAAGLAMPAAVGAPPALAGEPPSVGEHWYWDLGFGSLHGETASIILLVFFLLVVFSLLGAGGSSKKSSA
mmetsp:Transcript_1763/g.5555  ORF Transcript_1763/g.5555 Transcript_1763/m.5555 type:complete len:122 (+) Transcript_1763:70-435(+)